MSMPKGCQHGKQWEEECPLCTLVSIRSELFDTENTIQRLRNQLAVAEKLLSEELKVKP